MRDSSPYHSARQTPRSWICRSILPRPDLANRMRISVIGSRLEGDDRLGLVQGVKGRVSSVVIYKQGICKDAVQCQ